MGWRLKVDSRLLDGLVSENLPERILEDVTVAKASRVPVSISLRPLLAVAACMLFIAVPSAVLLLRRPSVVTPNRTQYNAAADAVRDIYASGTLLAGGLTLDRTRSSLLAENPLQNEIRNLTADTESAVRFVIANVGVAPPAAQLPN